MVKNKVVYVSLIADLLHAGHIRVLEKAAKYGEVTVGLLTQIAINELGDTAYLKYEQRKAVIQNLSMVSAVVPQATASYKHNLLELKPDYVVHGDNWVNCRYQAKYRKEVINAIKESQLNNKLIQF